MNGEYALQLLKIEKSQKKDRLANLDDLSEELAFDNKELTTEQKKLRTKLIHENLDLDFAIEVLEEFQD